MCPIYGQRPDPEPHQTTHMRVIVGILPETGSELPSYITLRLCRELSSWIPSRSGDCFVWKDPQSLPGIGVGRYLVLQIGAESSGTEGLRPYSRLSGRGRVILMTSAHGL